MWKERALAARRTITQEGVELLVALDGISAGENTNRSQLAFEERAGKQALQNVGTIEVVNAIGTDSTGLAANNLAVLHREVTNLLDVAGNVLDDIVELRPVDSRALLVEIEGDVLQTAVLVVGGVLAISVDETTLRAVMVGQVHKQLRLAVDTDLLVKVLGEVLELHSMMDC
jgi:predicted amino acid-binding ACT domain protein